MKKTKQSKRSNTAYPGLVKEVNLKIRQDLIDYDYIDKLSHEEKLWLSKFTDEYVGGAFKKDEDGSHSKDNIHSDSQRKDCYDRNNRRNNDIYAIKKSSDMLKDGEAVINYLEGSSSGATKNVEDTLIEFCDENIFDSLHEDN